MNPIDSELTPNLLIKASAGTGKTHQLSLRILRLLALKTAPSKIIALTFTRTAAAEFVRRAIKLIKEAAEDSNKHVEICKDARLAPEKHTQHSFKLLLAKTLLEYDQMLLGTLDSYFARLVNNSTQFCDSHRVCLEALGTLQCPKGLHSKSSVTYNVGWPPSTAF